MAGEAETEHEIPTQETPPGPTEEFQEPKGGDSLAGILAQQRREAREGELPPEKEEEEPPPSKSGPEGGEKEEKPPEGGEPPKPEEEEPPKFDPKHKSWEETEKARLEAEKTMHEKAEEASREREARETAEREREELRQKLAEKEAAKPPEKPVEIGKTPEELEAEQEARIEQALEEIGQLDEFAPDYKKKVAKAWRKAGIGGTGQPAIPDDKALKEMINRQVEERLKEREKAEEVSRAAADAAEAEKRQKEEHARTRAKAEELAQEAGLDMDKDSAEYDLFWVMAGRLPEELIKEGASLKDQVDWAVAEVRRKTGKVIETKEQQEKKARQAQTANKVLERGTTIPKEPPKEEAFTLGSLKAETRREAQARRT